jgi:hypothetical protein
LTLTGGRRYPSSHMALTIPPEDRRAIATLKAFAPSLLEQLISALRTAPPISNAEEMAAHVAKHVPSIPPERLASALETLYTLYYIRELSGVKPPRFLEDLMDGIRNSAEPRLGQKDLAKIRPILDKLLSIDTLKTVAKAARLKRDGERLYCESKILSDIRPVFQNDPTVPPVGAVLTHILKVGYHAGRDHLEFHVILDSDDLAALGDVVRRAEAKDKTLRELLKDVKLSNLGD